MNRTFAFPKLLAEPTNRQFLLNNWPRVANVTVVGLAELVSCDSEIHLLEGGGLRSWWTTSPAPANDRSRVSSEGVGGALREADGGHRLGEGEGRAQCQDRDVIQLIELVVLRMHSDLGDVPDVHIIVRDVMIP